MTSTESFFSLLKSHRESKGIEIQEIAEYTKINPKYLHAIEAGKFEVLPTVYMRLFLRSYVQFIGADTQQALNDYELHTTGKISGKIDTKIESPSEQTPNDLKEVGRIFNNSPIPPNQIITGFMVIVGLFLFFKLVSNLSERETENMPEVDPKANFEHSKEQTEIGPSPTLNPTKAINAPNILTEPIEDQLKSTEEVKKKI